MKFVEGHTVGIDLGTSYSSLSLLDTDGNATVVENAQGRPITPSVILLGDGGKVMIGPNPETVAEYPPDRVISAIKREMGSPFSVVHEGRKLTPELLSSMILTKLKQDAEKRIGTIGNAVITVPYYFNDPKRQATRHAGRIAGLNVVDIINEPTAATLCYAWQQNELGHPERLKKEKKVLVYDLGGGTFDVTLVKYTASDFNVVCTDGDTMLGGLDWTNRIAEYVADLFESKYGLDPRSEPVGKQRLLLEAEAAKRELTLWPQTTVRFEHHGQSVDVEVDRQQFENLTLDLLQRTQDTTEFVLDQAKLRPQDLDEVLLVGGSTSMPMVSRMLEETLQRKPCKDLNPHVAVAQGAAIHAAILEAKEGGSRNGVGQAIRKRLQSITTTDVNSHSLGVELTDRDNPGKKYNHIMIPRNSRLPVQAQQRFVTTSSRPRSIHVRLLEGETMDVSGCSFIGDFRLTELPENLPKGSPVEVNYGYDERGVIKVRMKELTGNHQVELAIEWSHGLDEKMIDGLKVLAKQYKVQ